MTLYSKAFTSLDTVEAVVECAKSIAAETRGEADLIVEIAVRPRPDKRAKPRQIKDMVPKDAEDWEQFGYDFRFKEGVFLWDGNEMHVTAGEASFLYRWLVEGNFNSSERYYINNLRSRYGAELLSEVARCKKAT